MSVPVNTITGTHCKRRHEIIDLIINSQQGYISEAELSKSPLERRAEYFAPTMDIIPHAWYQISLSAIRRLAALWRVSVDAQDACPFPLSLASTSTPPRLSGSGGSKILQRGGDDPLHTIY